MSKLVTDAPLSVPYVRFVKFEDETGETVDGGMIPNSPPGISPPTTFTVSHESLFSESDVEITFAIPAKFLVSPIPLELCLSGVLPWLEPTLAKAER